MDKKVMIVDDELDTRDALSRLLTRNGLEATAASGFDECLEHLKGGFRGVIFMDLIMPKKDGWDTIREIVERGYNEHTVIVLLTASMDPTPPKSKDLIKHVTDYIQKPADIKDIVETAKRCLGHLEN
ncbi:MAG: response regulator [Endomicrobiales bacterium]|nr:response regulator [Endomicrobiales bacterium]